MSSAARPRGWRLAMNGASAGMKQEELAPCESSRAGPAFAISSQKQRAKGN